MMPNYLSELPQFLAFLGMGLLLLGTFWALYMLVTPADELALIKVGNITAALVLAGAVIGFALPVAVAMSKSENIFELAQWGGVALIVQFVAYIVLRLIQRDLHQAIEQDRIAVGILAATISLSAGIINAGAQLI